MNVTTECSHVLLLSLFLSICFCPNDESYFLASLNIWKCIGCQTFYLFVYIGDVYVNRCIYIYISYVYNKICVCIHTHTNTHIYFSLFLSFAQCYVICKHFNLFRTHF